MTVLRRITLGFAILGAAGALGVIAAPMLLGKSAPALVDDAIHSFQGQVSKPPWERDQQAQQHPHKTPATPAKPSRPDTGPGPVERAVNGGLAGAAWAAKLFTAALAIMAAVLIPLRLYFRRRRAERLVVLELELSREDVAEPFEIEKSFESLRGQLLARWYTRICRGQDSISLELARRDLEDGQHEVRFLATCQPETVAALRAAIETLYPDVTLRALDSAQRRQRRSEGLLRHVVRRKLARRHIFTLQSTKDYQHSFIEGLATAAANLDGALLVQLCLTPAPGMVERRARRLLKRRERGLNQHPDDDDSDPGMTSVVEASELKGALEGQGHGLYYLDLRIAGSDRHATRQLGGTFGAAHSENELIPRHPHLLRHTLFLHRTVAAAPNLIPGLEKGIVSSSGLAYLWQLPRQRTKHAAIPRSSIRRATASRAICRDPEQMLLTDEHGPVGLHEPDRRFGYAALGGQGGGKSSLVTRMAYSDMRADPRKAVIALESKGSLVRALRSCAPTNRTVHYLDVGAPEFGLNLLAADATPGVRADMLVRAIREAGGPGSVMGASDSFLRNAAYAVCAAHRAAEHDGRAHVFDELGLPATASLSEVYWMLDATGDGYRQLIRELLAEDPESGFARGYWGEAGTFERMRADGPAFMAERLNAPKNKIERLISTPEVQRLLEHPQQLSIADVVTNGDILLINCNKEAVGEDNAVVIGHMVVQLLHRALQLQQQRPREDRRQVAVHIDEAHNWMTPTLATMAAEGREAGLELGVAYQYTAQVVDEVVSSGIKSLCQSLSVFRVRELDDARSIAGLAMELYQDMIQSGEEVQERLRFSVDDLVRVPTHHAINMWVAEGAPQPAFVGRTLPIEELIDPDVERHHIDAQHDRGYARPERPRDLRPPTPETVARLTLDQHRVATHAATNGSDRAAAEAAPALAQTMDRDELERLVADRDGLMGDDL